MATVFMKWLETNPKDYDRGIQLLTLGKIQRTKEKIAAVVISIDAAPAMLAEAE